MRTLTVEKGYWIVRTAALLVLALKLALSFTTYGTNDITYWKKFAELIAQHGTFAIYSLERSYNHPPLISWALKVISYCAAQTGLSFQFVFRLMPIFADYLSVVVIWELLSGSDVKKRTLLCVLCSINPVNFLISGFHGNTDPVFMAFVLLAICCIKRNRIFYAGLCYGLCLCVKIVPIIFLPVFFFYFRSKKDRALFMASSALLPAAVFLPYLYDDFGSVVRNIFSYGSEWGLWGISHLLNDAMTSLSAAQGMRMAFGGISHLYFDFGKYIVLLMIFFFSRRIFKNETTRNYWHLVEGCFAVLGIFLIFTPGFGVQYLSWISYFAVMAMPGLGTVYILLGGFFLFRVYAHWGAAVHPFYADFDRAGPWIGFDKMLDLVLWALLIVMLARFLKKGMAGHEALT